MSFARAVRAVAATSVLAVAVGLVTTTSAEASGKPAPGPTGLAAAATAHPGGGYDVAASWDPTANATGYKVAITKNGATLVSTTVKTTTWTPTVASTPGDAFLVVRAVVAKKPGRPTSFGFVLPDITAPTGSFATSKVDATLTGTITQTDLADDSGTAGVTRTVDWGDGGAAEAWTTGTTIDHVYSTIGRYVPTVTLSDAAHNSVTYTLGPIVLGDVTQPTGTVTVTPPSAWATLTHVVVTPSSLADDYTPGDKVAVAVAWGDGATSDSSGSAPLDHVYAAAGVYDVSATLTDESGNATALVPVQVTVTADSVGPVVRFVLPKSKHSVRAFRTLKGKATDTGGTGVAKVTVKAVEKRGTAWYGYNARSRTWLKASSKAKAYGRARAAVVTTTSNHVWTVTLRGLRKGTLVYRVFAKDKVANKSATITHQAALTRR